MPNATRDARSGHPRPILPRRNVQVGARPAMLLAMLLAGLAWPNPAAGQLDLPFDGLANPNGSSQPEYLRVEAVASHDRVMPGQEITVALRFEVADEWVLYSPRPGRNVLPDGEVIEVGGAGVDIRLDGWWVEEALWPPHRPYVTEFPVEGGTVELVNYVYKDANNAVFIGLEAPSDARPGTKHTLGFTLRGQVCAAGGQCVPVEQAASVTIEIARESQASSAWTDDLAAGRESALTLDELGERHDQAGDAASLRPGSLDDQASMGVLAALGLALLAGLTLNIMPCVLPIIPLRIYSIVAMGRENPRRIVTLGLAFAAGMFAFFVALAVLAVVLKLALGIAFSLSLLFQMATTRYAMAMLATALALNLFGVFTVTVPSAVANLEGSGAPAQAGGHGQSAWMGFMMGILSTPCSFAYLAAAIGWAQAQPAWLGFITIATIGVGMAFPHALLVARPSLIARLPRPGAWMEHFKQAMGFVMLGVAGWLISGGYPELMWMLLFAVVLSMGLWAWSSWVRYDAPFGRKLVVRGAVVLAVGLCALTMLPGAFPGPEGAAQAAAKIDFVPYRDGLIRRRRQAGQAVLVKFTANWCTECKILDRTVYGSPEVARAIAEHRIVPVVADTSDRGSDAGRLLYETFRSNPPLSVVYPPEGKQEPIAFVGSFSARDLVEAIGRAAPDANAAPPAPDTPHARR